MTASFRSHLILVVGAHLLLLVGSLQLAKHESVRRVVRGRVIQLSLASQLATGVLSPKKVAAVPQPKKTIAKNASQQAQTEKVPTAPRTGSEEAMGQGTGQGQGVGSGSSLGDVAKADLRTIYQSELRGQIEKNKSYPPVSRRLGHTGLVVVAFTLLEDGLITDVRIDSGSSYDRLNDSALDAVKKVGKFKPIPKELGMAKMDIRIPIKFFTL